MIYYNLIYLTILGCYSYMCVCIYIFKCLWTNNGVFENKNGWISNYSLYKIGFVNKIFVRMIIYNYKKNTNDFHIKYLIPDHFQVTIKWSINFFVSEYINFKIIFSAKRSWALIRKLWVHIDISLSLYSYISYN